MGQAKRRGTLEERATQSAERKRAEVERRAAALKAQQDAWRAANPEKPLPVRRPSAVIPLALASALLMGTNRNRLSNRRGF